MVDPLYSDIRRYPRRDPRAATRMLASSEHDDRQDQRNYRPARQRRRTGPAVRGAGRRRRQPGRIRGLRAAAADRRPHHVAGHDAVAGRGVVRGVADVAGVRPRSQPGPGRRGSRPRLLATPRARLQATATGTPATGTPAPTGSPATGTSRSAGPGSNGRLRSAASCGRSRSRAARQGKRRPAHRTAAARQAGAGCSGPAVLARGGACSGRCLLGAVLARSGLARSEGWRGRRESAVPSFPDTRRTAGRPGRLAATR